MNSFQIHSTSRCHKIRQAAAGHLHTIHQLFLCLLAQAVPGQGALGAGLVGVEGDVVIVHAVGRVQRNHRVGGEPAALHNFLQHGLAIGIDPLGLGAHHRVVQNGRKRARQIPCLEERTPVNEAGQFAQVKVLEHAPSDELRHGRRVTAPVDHSFVSARLLQAPQRRLLLVGVLVAHFFVVFVQLVNELGSAITEQALRHAHAARGVRHIDHGAFVMRGNAHGGVHATGGCAANQQGNLLFAEVIVLLHLASQVLHLFQAGRDQTRQANDVGALGLGARQYLMGGHHDAHVDHVKVVALQDHGDDVLADVVHIALHGGDDDLALALDVAPCRRIQTFFFFNIGNQMRHGLLHDPRALDHLWQKHLALAKQVADDVHAIHQRAFNDVQRSPAGGQNGAVGFFGVLRDEVGDAVHHGVAQALADWSGRIRRAAPLQFFALVFGAAFGGLGDLDQALPGIRPAVQHHILDPLT